MQRHGARIDDTKPIWRTMLVFLIPLMLSNVLQSASGTFTSIFLGRLIGVHALAAASSMFPVLFFLISFFFGIASASTVLIGQAYGAHDQPRLSRAAGTTLMFALAFGVVLGAIGFIFGRPLLQLINTPPDILDDAVRYADIVFATLPVLFVYLSYTTFLRGIGDSRSPLIVLVASTAIGVVLAPFLIRGAFGWPGLGIIGAPISNVVSTGAGLAGLLVFLEVHDNPLAFSKIRHYLRIEVPLLLTLIRIGIPTGLQFVMVSLSEIAVLSFVNRFGSSATAAYGAVNQIVSYVQFPAISIGITSSIFGAQSIGAGRLDRLRKIVRAGVTLNYVVGGILITVVYLLAREILSLFLTDQATLNTARDLLSITLWSYVIFGNTSVLSGMMRSSGSVLWPTAISICTIWGVEVPIAWVLSNGPLGLRGIWYAYPIAFIVALTLQSSYYFLVWRRRPIRALHASPLADAEGERIEEAAG
ncbi:MAG TPA: MATE family efflux transporter [Candidatus Lustribacter sp.]|jgi:putative MATE family efflux protein|nr:MATE family efflux transporter [Candidatus Lustribacter sp.]